MIFRKANLLQIKKFKELLFYIHEKEFPGLFTLENSLLEIPNSKNYLITRKKRIVGFVSFIESEKEIEIKRIFLYEEYRRKKIGTKLILKIKNLFPNKKIVSGIYLNTAKLFFESLDFKEIKKENNKITMVLEHD